MSTRLYRISGPTSDPTSTPSGTAARHRVPSAPPRRSGVLLLSQAARVLAEAADAETADERFRLAHLAALRAAAALFAERTQPNARRRPTNAWVLLTSVAPELSDWAAYFSAGASARAALEAGVSGVVTPRQADDLLRAAGQFMVIVESTVGVLAVAG